METDLRIKGEWYVMLCNRNAGGSWWLCVYGSQHEFLMQKLRDLELVEIEGYKTRIKHFPSFHQDEPDIAFYAKVD